nr:hypothetical protein [Tanacetum cinerariifolium]
MNYLEEQTDGEAMINSIQNGDQPLPVIAQVSLARNATNAPPTLKDLKFWTAKEKKTQKIDRLARSLLIQGLPDDIYSLIDSNEAAKDLWDALERQMRGSEYGEQDRKATILYEYETFKAIEGEQLLNTHLHYLQVINDLNKCGYKKDNCDVNDALGYKKKAIVITSDPLALVAEKTKITALLAKAFNRRKFYSKPTNNNLRTSSTSQSANKKQEFVKLDDKKEDKNADEKKRDMSKVKCYNCKKEGHFAKDCKKAKTKMLLAKKDSDEQVLLAEDQAWMESSSDSDQEINANIVFMAQIEKVLSESDKSSSSAEETIAKFPIIHQPPQEMSIQEMEDLKQQYFDEMKRLIILEYRDEFKIDELKENFNSMSIEINEKEKLLQLEQLANLSTYPSKHFNSFCYDDDDDEAYTIAVTPNQFEDFSDSNDEFSSTNDDSFSIDNIEYVESSPPNSVSSEVMEIVILEVGGIDDDILLTIKYDILREKLLNINLLIAKIEALNDNPTPSSDFMTKSFSTSLNSLLEETNTFDNSLPEFETFCFDVEEISSVSTTTRSDIFLPEYEAFYDDHVK